MSEKKTFYVVSRVHRQIRVDGVVVQGIENAFGFLPVFETRKEAKEYVKDDSEILEFETLD